VRPAHLYISLYAASESPPKEVEGLNELWGGAEALLRWLETRLGLFPKTRHQARRVASYLKSLEKGQGESYQDSFAADRWSTAEQLLMRRDDLLLHGWDGQKSPSLPRLVNDLAAIEDSTAVAASGIPDRISSVLRAMDAGQQLPPHNCILDQSPDDWPPLWRDMLDRLEIQIAPEVHPAAEKTQSLGQLQRSLVEQHDPEFSSDESLSYFRAESCITAAQALVAMLSVESDRLEDTIICCEDEEVARLVDGALAAAGLPTAGVVSHTRSHPANQVLPLALALCWEPVDPSLVLNFLSLPISPIPQRVARKLANALMAQPGLGSEAWTGVIEQLSRDSNDADRDERSLIDEWLHGKRVSRSAPMPQRIALDCVGRVAQWASARSAGIENAHNVREQDLETAHALRHAATDAALVGELIEDLDADLRAPQLQRILNAVAGSGSPASRYSARVDGPTWVVSPAQVRTPYDRLVWVGLGTSEKIRSRWPRSDLALLTDAGIDVDDGTTALNARRKAEVRGLSRISKRLLLFELSSDDERPPHALASYIRYGLDQGREGSTGPLSVERIVGEGETENLAPWIVTLEQQSILGSPFPRPLWELPSGLLSTPEKNSATELEGRLGCPIQWTFKYAARLRSGPIGNLPSDFKLKGDFSHFILKRVFGDGGPVPETDEAVRLVEEVFDDRVGLDAAPLAMPVNAAERKRLRSELVDATRTLVSLLHAGEYRIAGMEEPFEGNADDLTLRGYVDCRLESSDGSEALVDFKYGGVTKYRNLLAEGKPVQLAVYARGLSAASGKALGEMPVGYLIIAGNRFLTPGSAPVAGTTAEQRVDGAPAIGEVWRRLVQAISTTQAWLAGDEPVPARPLQKSDSWPKGVEMLLDENGKDQNICKHCDYRLLCGIDEVD
jgi:ATP-dependent helicase/nuclease subunit B